MAMFAGKHTQPKVINAFDPYLYTAAILSTKTNYYIQCIAYYRSF